MAPPGTSKYGACTEVAVDLVAVALVDRGVAAQGVGEAGVGIGELIIGDGEVVLAVERGDVSRSAEVDGLAAEGELRGG